MRQKNDKYNKLFEKKISKTLSVWLPFKNTKRTAYITMQTDNKKGGRYKIKKKERKDNIVNYEIEQYRTKKNRQNIKKRIELKDQGIIKKKLPFKKEQEKTKTKKSKHGVKQQNKAWQSNKKYQK